MQKISSDIVWFRWGFSVVLIVVSGLITLLTGQYGATLCWIAAMLFLITAATVFDEKRSGTIFKILASFLSLAAIPLSAFAWWSGLPFMVTGELFNIRKPVIKILIASLGVAAGLTLSFCMGSATIKSLILAIGAVAVYGIVSAFFERLQRLNEDYEDALKKAALDSFTERKLREELSYKMAEEEMNARLLERERISRDIHNSVGHTLSAASVTIDAAKILVDSDKDQARAKMTVANDRIKESIDSIRSVVRTLNDKNNAVLVKDYMRSLAELASNFAMDTDVKVYNNFEDIDDEGSIDISLASFISGALSELLTNGLKHGKATVFVIMFTLDPKHILFKVQDNGKGFGDITSEEEHRLLDEGFGLKKIKSHAASLGGSLQIDGSDGFKVTCDLPRIEVEGGNDGIADTGR